MRLDRAGPVRVGDSRAWLRWWGPALLWMGLIFLLSSQPDIPGPEDPTLKRLLLKSAHAVGYGVLALTYRRAIAGSGRRRPLPLALLLTLLYAISDEWHQTYVPGRTGQPLDVLIDLGGAVVALFLWQRRQVGDDFDPPP